MTSYRYYFDANTWDKFLTEIVDKIKKRWLKKDKQQLKELELQSKKLDIEKDIAYSNYIKIEKKCEKVENKIYRLNQKYTYQKKIKVKNPNYQKEEIITI
jgi:hypothetical protein